MSRAFSAVSPVDNITFTGGTFPASQGPITIGVLAKADSTAGWTGWAFSGRNAGNTKVASMLTSNNAGPKLFMENDFTNGVSGLSTSWRWYIVTKGSGAVVPRWHIWDLSGSWSHVNTDGNVPNNSGPITTMFIGDGSSSWRGSIAAVAVTDTAFNDSQVEATFTNAAVDLLGMDWAVLLNQSSTSDPVLDITGNGGDQDTISGTSIDADDPDFDYSLASGPQMYVYNGSIETLGAVSVWNGTSEVPAVSIEIAS